MKLFLKPGIKLKNAPLAYRLALRLVTRAERRLAEADLNELATELSATVPEVLAAANELAKDGAIAVTRFAMPVITFSVDEKVKKSLLKMAHGYRMYLDAERVRAAERAARPPETPCKLPPIDEELRKKALKVAKPLAAKLMARAKEHAEWQMAGCIVRIGQPAVAALVDEVCASEIDNKIGVFRHFFNVYKVKRDALK